MNSKKEKPEATLDKVLNKLAATKARAEGRKPYPPADRRTDVLLGLYSGYKWAVVSMGIAAIMAFCISQYAMYLTAPWWKKLINGGDNGRDWFVLIEIVTCIIGSIWLVKYRAKKTHPGAYVENFYYAVAEERHLLTSAGKALVAVLREAMENQPTDDFSWQHWLTDRAGESRFLYVPSYWENAMKKIAKCIADDQLVGKGDVEARRKEFSSLVALANSFLPGRPPIAEKDLFPKSKAPVAA